MHIVFDHQAFVIQEFGGVSRIFAALAQELAMDGAARISIFGGLHINRHLEELRHHSSVRVVGRKVPRALGKQRVLMPINRKWFSRYLEPENPAIIHFTYFDQTCRRSPATREIMTVHDMIHDLYPETDHGGGVERRKKHQMLARVDGIVCVSHNTLADLHRFASIPEDRAIVIPHSSAMASVTPSALGPLPSPFLLFVGKRRGYKNFDFLLQQLSRSTAGKGWHLIAFGGGPFSPAEVRAIKACGLADRVHWRTGDDADLAALYRAAVALVYPSRYEGFGLPVLEAMGCGCPVIACAKSSIPEVAGEAALLFPPDDAESLLGHLETLADSTARQALIEKGYAQARLYSWRRSADKLMAFYKDLIKRPPRGIESGRKLG